jgi:hypothetical protein
MVISNTSDLPGTPPGGDTTDEPGRGIPAGKPGTPAGDDAPIGIRKGGNPANIGDEVTTEGDMTFPSAVPEPAQI